MEFLSALWLPILLSGVFVFIVSSILHMCIPIHKGDYEKMPDEDAVLESMRGSDLKPGCYMFPCPGSMQEMGTPEMIEKYKQGPVGFMSVIPSGPPGIGKNLLQWFIFTVVVGVFVAHVAHFSMAGGTEFNKVFHLTALVSFMAYGLTSVTESIWKGVPWGITAKFLFDGFLYALTTGATFAWLWPEAA